ncbi:MAG: phosphopantetheine-binding protein [Lachnospiraceae bacterium]|jgi:D-alanine--poly(phosphoribitol) ligase subunit 2|nr:phosphopantetheine-binding protein [Lachnospiraceae bacterium]
MEQLLEILNELHPEVDFRSHSHLIDEAVLDSFDIVSLIGDLNEAFSIEISFDDIDPDNFNSAEAIMAMIQRLQAEV